MHRKRMWKDGCPSGVAYALAVATAAAVVLGAC